MKNKIVLVSIDGFGVGSMPDSKKTSNTWKTIDEYVGADKLKFIRNLVKNSEKLSLDYPGADSYLGHLILSGLKLSKLELNPLSCYITEIENILTIEKYSYEIYNGMIVVEDKFIIYDNFEADHGLAINIGGCKDKIPFEEQQLISSKIRKIIKNPRLISFSANKISINDYKKNWISNSKFNGVNTPKTGVYNNTFEVIHYPAINDFTKTIQVEFSNSNYMVYMYGKFGDIIRINNDPNIKTYKNIDPDFIFNKVSENNDNFSFHCVNIQQTDLAGHSGDTKEYSRILEKIEPYLEKLSKSKNVKLIITADHGNDPNIKDGKHTREFVPLWTNYKFNSSFSKVLSSVPKIIKEIK